MTIPDLPLPLLRTLTSFLAPNKEDDERHPWRRRDVWQNVLNMVLYRPARLCSSDFSIRAHRRRLARPVGLNYCDVLNLFLSMPKAHPFNATLKKTLADTRKYASVNPERAPHFARFLAKALELAALIETWRGQLVEYPELMRLQREKNSWLMCDNFGEAYAAVATIVRRYHHSLIHSIGQNAGTFLHLVGCLYFNTVMRAKDRERWYCVKVVDDLDSWAVLSDSDDDDYGWESYACGSDDVGNVAEVIDVDAMDF